MKTLEVSGFEKINEIAALSAGDFYSRGDDNNHARSEKSKRSPEEVAKLKATAEAKRARKRFNRASKGDAS